MYCLGNPVRFVDIKGKEPGDAFKYPTLAALDFGKIYNPQSIRNNIEYATFIYKMKDARGNIYYTYAGPTAGASNKITANDMRRIDRSCLNMKECVDVVATIHTHGTQNKNSIDNGMDWNNQFSGEQTTPQQNKAWKGELGKNGIYIPDDISEANRTKTYSYVVTPNGSLKGYNPKTGRITTWSSNMPNHRDVSDNYENLMNEIWKYLKNLLR